MCACSGYAGKEKSSNGLSKLKTPFVLALIGGGAGYFWAHKKGGDKNDYIKFILIGVVAGYVVGSLLFSGSNASVSKASESEDDEDDTEDEDDE